MEFGIRKDLIPKLILILVDPKPLAIDHFVSFNLIKY